MKKILLTLALMAGLAAPVYAQDGVLNEPSESAQKFVAVVEALDPSVDTIWFIKNSNWTEMEAVYGASASVYRFKSDGFRLGSVRLGYAFEDGARVYGGVRADLEGLMFRYLPDEISGFPTAEFLDTTMKLTAKYLKVGVMAGYDFEGSDIIWGPTVGGRITF